MESDTNNTGANTVDTKGRATTKSKARSMCIQWLCTATIREFEQDNEVRRRRRT